MEKERLEVYEDRRKEIELRYRIKINKGLIYLFTGALITMGSFLHKTLQEDSGEREVREARTLLHTLHNLKDEDNINLDPAISSLEDSILEVENSPGYSSNMNQRRVGEFFDFGGRSIMAVSFLFIFYNERKKYKELNALYQTTQ